MRAIELMHLSWNRYGTVGAPGLRSAKGLVLILTAALLLIPAARAERLIIRILNADTGGPMSHQNVLIEWDADAEESIVYVGGKGRGEMETLAGGVNFTMRPAFKDWGDPNRLAYFSCSGPVVAVEAQQARRSGFVARNLCSDRTATAAPGEIIFWARPLPLLKPDFQ
jgi:hypothetical protein